MKTFNDDQKIKDSLIIDDLPNGTKEQLRYGVLHNKKGYYVSNQGTNKNPSYYVWIPSLTHSNVDSTYNDISLAVTRCNYLFKANIKFKNN